MEIHVAPHLWTLEKAKYGSHVYEVWHPDTPEPRDEDYTAVVYEPRRVVVLSTGPTNLRFVRPEHMPGEFECDERQQRLIEDALAAHRRSQASGN
jgi:hypothetical protein